MGIAQITLSGKAVAPGRTKKAAGTVLLFVACILLGAAAGCLIRALLAQEPFVRWFIYGCATFAGSIIGFIID